ncbi:hypothetical protein roselon_02053 [Roseibacterium elongatum DSM 19469]|uniref:Glycosyltransferase 61 catalytic domain-containing protein n=2 Tax=Roseicyclus elongatus TaxID=159346 RepID=W8RT91_9RHOB|nr:hypothetical protein roselon_02053 [Roseibacterium elongatum DSM 19469]
MPLDFDPLAPMAWQAGFHRDVTLVPWGENPVRGAKRAAGLFDATGAFMPEGQCWRYRAGPITVPPVPPAEMGQIERLEGRWLFGGLCYGHFGHFLVESSTRLWALDALDGIEGIVFYPKQQLTHERRQFRHLLPFFAAMGLEHLAIRAPQKPVVIDELAVPPPGFGMEEMMAGRPEFRAWMRDNLGAAIAADGPEAVYVSRSRLPSKRGSVLMEDRLEHLMEAAGYTVIHPQEHPLEQQIALWKAARRIVSLDGSALHLAAMVVDPATQVAILNRGPSQNIEDYILQFNHFAGIAPLRVEAINGFFSRAGKRVKKRETYATLDFPSAGAQLAAAGFIPSAEGWSAPTADTVASAAAEAEADLGEPLARHEMTWA